MRSILIAGVSAVALALSLACSASPTAEGEPGVSQARSSPAQSPEAIASQLIAAHPPGMAYSRLVAGTKGRGALTLEDAAFKLLTGADAKVVGERWARPLHEEFKRLDIPSADVTGVIAILATPGMMSPDGKLTQQGIDRHLTRLKAITPALFQSWRTANKFKVDDIVLVHLLVAHEPLFVGTRAQRELRRFESLSSEAVSAWSDAAGEPAVDAAFELLKVPALFANDTFDKTRFDRALPIAKRLLAERGQKP